ncbi:solute carrier family 22 member 3-like isoform X2 [Agrilus planipennis]|uniref:Solute carrier family 22 member 3-like isoform X2 n=1 Tax=Agrilus planipennis TaxID=224129 RepID=A0A1W4WLC5_AGRPL|nr:solute carrier family 22 member 3-like isoform X2 [Agrilus planipennis]
MNDLNGNLKLEIQQASRRDFVQETVGDFGRWQFKISLLMSLLKLPMAWFQLGIVFIAPPFDFTCKVPTEQEGKDWKLIAQPNSCYLRNISALNETASKIPCDWGYEYDRSTMKSTIIMEWNLVCQSARLVEVTQITFMFGVLLGSVIFGVAADRYGRKSSLIVAIILQAVCGIISSLVSSFWIFVFVRFFLALGNGGTLISSFVMCMESVSGTYRTIVPILYQTPYVFGNLIMTFLAYYLNDWRKLNLVLSVLSCLFISYIWLLSESPRWLLAVGKKMEALKILKAAARMNNKKSPVEFRKDEENYFIAQVFEKPNFSQLLVTPELRKRTIFLSLSWFLTGVIFFALSQYMSSVGKNIYLSVIASGALAVPGTIMCIFIIRKTGRKKTIIFANILTTVSTAAIAFFPKGEYTADWPRLILSALVFTGISMSLPAFFLFTGELYPTTLRNAGSGGTIMFSKIGSMVAPFLLTLQSVFESLTVIVLAALGLLTIVFIAPLPETMGKELLETVADLQKQKLNKKNIQLTDNESFEDKDGCNSVLR